MNNGFIYRLLLGVGVLLGAFACAKEDLPTDIGPYGEGESEVALGVTFRPLAGTSLGKTRSERGDLIGSIDDVFVVWYKADSTLAGCRYLSHDELTITDVKRGTTGETTTQHADFTCRIPYGRYRIYAVANMGDLTDDGRIAAETTFKAIPLTWNPGDVAANCQMSGYFSLSEETAYAKGNAELLSIDRPNLTLHAWVRRAASKVTIAFDASKLNENIYIYLEYARIMDVPLSCPLVDANRPTDRRELLHEGDTIRYGTGADYTNWPRIACGRGANTYGDHANDAPSLFFFENMQGVHPGKHQYKNFEEKDDVLCGTYVEVKGYYLNKSADAPSYGDITYRCMLGRNMTDDFNAERNAHYKLTLVFNQDANDPDWHIVYDYEPAPPEIVVPNPMYISYLSNQELNIPVTVYYDKELATVKTLTAEIVTNDWGYYDHPYQDATPELKKLTNGFLSLAYVEHSSVSDRTAESVYPKTKTFQPTSHDDDSYRFDIPVYTRPMTLGSSFSGNNYYIGRRRYAQVRMTVTFQNKITGADFTLSETVDVIQVRRLVNPKGIWRKGDSVKPFRVTLKNTDSNPNMADVFDDVISDGPWTASVLKGEDWVRIKDAEAGEEGWGTTPITGGTGSKVEFDYRPATETSECRFGLIEIRFHNNTCSHIILVSQGIGPVDIGGHKWHMTNVRYCGVDEANPLLEGSMFKFGWSSVAFRSTNNLKPGYGFREEGYYSTFDTFDADGNPTTHVFKDVPADVSGFTSSAMNKSDAFGSSHVATYEEWQTLTDLDKFNRYYGVLYGDECTTTLDTNTKTNTYTNEGDECGMRGCFICDKNTGVHLFFPIGNTGHGRRQYRDDYERGDNPIVLGSLKYADRAAEMPKKTAESLPCYYNLWEQFGAIYWYKQKSSNNNYGFDINYFTFGFGSYGTRHVWSNKNNDFSDPKQDVAQSDICLLRRVYD